VAVDDEDEAPMGEVAAMAAAVAALMAEPWFDGLGMGDLIAWIDELASLLDASAGAAHDGNVDPGPA
jgi:hypothetical protein